MKVLLPYNGGIKKPNPFKTLHSIVNTRVLKNKKKITPPNYTKYLLLAAHSVITTSYSV